MNQPLYRPTAHLFCKVVDHFGDAGIAWMLATGLARDHGFEVTLFIDDMATLQKLAPDYAETENIHIIDTGPRACPGDPSSTTGLRIKSQGPYTAETADLVIEMLAGTASDSYSAHAAQGPKKPVWIIYEHLSAEDWVEGCHLKSSPHPRLNLPRTFFYPGFTENTGGLLYRDRGILPEKEPKKDQKDDLILKIGLFSYENAGIPHLLTLFATGSTRIQLKIPENRASLAVSAFLGRESSLNIRTEVTRDSLHVTFMPFMPRAEFDAYLAGNDINFVRGEESVTSAIMAGKPLIWHIYYQEDSAHLTKLAAFCRVYTDGLSPAPAAAFTAMNHAWNGVGDVQTAWPAYVAHLPEIAAQARHFAARRRKQGSALKNLVDFYKEHC